MAREYILKTMTRPKEGCLNCLKEGLCYHRLMQTEEHLCFCENQTDCFGGSFVEICKYQTYEQRQGQKEGFDCISVKDNV